MSDDEEIQITVEELSEKEESEQEEQLEVPVPEDTKPKPEKPKKAKKPRKPRTPEQKAKLLENLKKGREKAIANRIKKGAIKRAEKAAKQKKIDEDYEKITKNKDDDNLKDELKILKDELKELKKQKEKEEAKEKEKEIQILKEQLKELKNSKTIKPESKGTAPDTDCVKEAKHETTKPEVTYKKPEQPKRRIYSTFKKNIWENL